MINPAEAMMPVLRPVASLALLIALAIQAVSAQAPADRTPACATEGEFQLLCSKMRFEDLLPVPGTDWVLATSINGGGLHAINAKTRADIALYPSPSAAQRADEATYGRCARPLPPTSEVSLTGLAVAAGKAGGLHVVYAVDLNLYKPNTGPDRVGIQVFELDLRGGVPRAAWIGCLTPPEGVGLNSVALLPGGGLLATNFNGGEGVTREKVAAGQHMGQIWEWRPGSGWVKVPGSELPGPNGIVVSPDGKNIIVSAWGAQQLVRLERDASGARKQAVALDYRMDNMHWAANGDLIGAGHRDSGPSVVVKIDPRTLKLTTLFEKPETELFHHFTSAVRVGEEIWISASRSTGIGIIRRPD